uniref:DNA repair protein Rad7 n=1 Tax=Ganoderma boninense TaxID=34458 RepID=A0A5K1JX12_9APHY|nr:DNA repair protein Rad7 [Ganoderma boninense]
MGGRKRSRNTSGPAPKRRKADTTNGQGDDDIPNPQSQPTALSTSTFSVRTSHTAPEHIPSLAVICARAFASNLQKLSSDPGMWEDVKYSLKHLPDALVQKVFAVLKQTRPALLSHGFIAPYLLRGSSIALSDDLPGVSRPTIFAIGDMPLKDNLRDLELTGFAKIADKVFASVIAKLPSLRKLNLRHGRFIQSSFYPSLKMELVEALEVVNFNYTTVSPASMAPLVFKCTRLEVLKVAGIASWTDGACSRLWASFGSKEDFHLPNLRSLKLRQAPLSDTPVNTILEACPNLLRLDLSFTQIKNLVLPSNNLLEKLVLTSTMVPSDRLVSLISGLSRLQVLSLGAMGSNDFSTTSMSSSPSGTTINDKTLRALTDALEGSPDLERVSLVWNTRIGYNAMGGPDVALSHFIRRVGRRCKVRRIVNMGDAFEVFDLQQRLNLSGLLHLRSSNLEGLANPDGPEEGPSQLVYLNLNNTPVDDIAVPYISSCVNLKVLELAGTKITKVGLFHILDACPNLQTLDLTSCRGVKVGERRQFFEVWEEWKNE